MTKTSPPPSGPDGTSQTDAVTAFLDRVEPPNRQAEARLLIPLFQEVTGFPPLIWAKTMVGFGRYAYTYASGHSGESLATGFAPRRAELVIYILPGFAGASDLLSRLGPHRTGKACLYLRCLDQVDLDVLRQLVREGLADLATRWTVLPS